MLQLFFGMALMAAPVTLHLPPLRSLNLLVETMESFARESSGYTSRTLPCLRLAFRRILSALLRTIRLYRLVMGSFFFYTLLFGFLRWQWQCIRTIQVEINDLKKQVRSPDPTAVAAVGVDGSQEPPQPLVLPPRGGEDIATDHTTSTWVYICENPHYWCSVCCCHDFWKKNNGHSFHRRFACCSRRQR